MRRAYDAAKIPNGMVYRNRISGLYSLYWDKHLRKENTLKVELWKLLYVLSDNGISPFEIQAITGNTMIGRATK
jgi:hypothetical protein